jgi:hypothetical protein
MLTLGKRLSLAVVFLGYLALAPQAGSESSEMMPKVEGESLSGQKVRLPEAASGKVAVLVFGFTKTSKVATSAWAKKLSADFSNRAEFALYQLPVLEDVPRLVRGMVISSMRKGVPEKARDHFVPILSGEAELKKLVSYKESDDAYLVVLDRTGTIVQQTHGQLSAASYSPLRGEVDSLLGDSK